MSLMSFLTQNPMQYTQGTTQSSTTMPQWYNDYTQGILQNAASYANQGYQPYQGPRVAGLTDASNTAANNVANVQNTGYNAANQGMDVASNAINSPTGAQVAQSYANAASVPLSMSMQPLMNNYLNDVVNTNNYLSSRNFAENTLPQLQDQFTSSGQVYGGSRQGEMAERMARDLNLNQQMAGANTLAQGFNSALQGANMQSGIYSNLGNMMGALTNAGTNSRLYGAGVLGSLGTTAQSDAINAANALNTYGLQQQGNTQSNYNLAYQDFLNQRNFPLTAASAMQGALSGVQIPTGVTNYSYQPYQPALNPMSAAGAMYGGAQSAFAPGGLLNGMFGTNSSGNPGNSSGNPTANTVSNGVNGAASSGPSGNLALNPAYNYANYGTTGP